MTQMIQTTQKTMHNQTLQKWATLSNTVTWYSLSQTLMSNALQYKASKGFRYIYYICRWCWGGGGVHHNFWEIWRGVRANLRLLRGGYCVIFLLARLIFRPPLLIIIAQSLTVFKTSFVSGVCGPTQDAQNICTATKGRKGTF